MSLNRVPPEVWSNVLQYVPHIEQTKLLHVSPRLHDIALDLVFSAVKIYFIGGEGACVMLNTIHPEFAEETTEKLMTRSWEILRRITKDPSFARVVKTLTVVAFNYSPSTFEKLCLADALTSLPYLRTFRWRGTSPELGNELAGNISAKVQSIYLQTYVPSLEAMQRFTNLKHLTFPTPFLFPDDEEAHDAYVINEEIFSGLNPGHLKRLLGTMRLESLQSLTVDGQCVSSIPIRIFSDLKELTISLTTDCESLGLDLVFRHALQLESLTLFGFIDQNIFLLFVAESPCLPLLQSFRLSCDGGTLVETPAPELLDILFGFIGERTNLRRLYLRIPTIYIPFNTSPLNFIGKLKHLEVFGFHTGRTPVDDSFLEEICNLLPKNIKAFHLAMDWCGTYLLQLVDFLAELPNLTFAHFYGTMGRLPILLKDLANEVPTLQTVGLNRALWTVDRSGPDVELNKWPRWKIKFCGEEDFLCDDHFWLFQYN